MGVGDRPTRQHPPVRVECELERWHGGREAKGFVHDYHCCVRERLGSLVEKRDVWWLIDATAERVFKLMYRE